MTRPFSLVSDSLSHETEKCLASLLDDAKNGHLVGIAFAAMYKGGTYIVNAAGEAYRSPTFARGMVADLSEQLGKINTIDH